MMSAALPPIPLSDRFLAAYFRRGWRGFWRLMNLGGKKFLLQRSSHGATFALSPLEYIDAIVLRESYYEPEVIDSLRPFLVPGAVFWDIGANIGLHAVTAARLAPGVRIVAFEPNPTTFARLDVNARLNQADLNLQSLALGDRDGEITLHMNTTGNAGMSSLVHATAGPGTPVRLARAESLVAAGIAPAPTVMKIDVEGAEEAVLRGFGSLLAAPTLRAVTYETAADLLSNPQQCAATRLLLVAGFQLRALPRADSSVHLLANFIAYRL